MDCKTVHLLLDFARPAPTELEASEQEALENHLLECSACARLANDERRFDTHLGAAMRAVSVPAGLKERLLGKLEGDVQHVHRQRRVRAYWSLAAAAALLGIVWGGSLWFSRARVLDPTAVADRAWEEINPQRDKVDQWLSARKLRVQAPEQFNYALLTDYRMTELEGKQVPMLLFTRVKDDGRVATARVYLLNDRTFDFNALFKTAWVGQSGFTMTVFPHPTDPRLAYLVVYTGVLDPFLVESTQLSASS
jgi:hypothetical protein